MGKTTITVQTEKIIQFENALKMAGASLIEKNDIGGGQSVALVRFRSPEQLFLAGQVFDRAPQKTSLNMSNQKTKQK